MEIMSKFPAGKVNNGDPGIMNSVIQSISNERNTESFKLNFRFANKSIVKPSVRSIDLTGYGNIDTRFENFDK